MKQTDVTVTFYLKKSEMNDEGHCPVMAKLVVGKFSEAAFSAKMSVPAALWASGRATGKSNAAREINRQLDDLRASAISIYDELSATRENVTAEEIRNLLLGTAFGQETLLGYFRTFIEHFEKRVGVNREKGTAQSYRYACNCVAAFIQEKYKLSDVPFTALNRSFIDNYDLYLRTERRFALGTIVLLVTRLNTIVGEAIAEGIITADPFAGYEAEHPEREQKYLTAAELQRLMTTPLHDPKLYHIRDLFLFSCYTGIPYGDMCRLTTEDLEVAEDGEVWIKTARKKTKIDYEVPLLDIPLLILDKYRDMAPEGKLLPMYSNNELNRTLKRIAAICGIERKLVFHCGRHTYATEITLSHGVPLETVSKTLGHSRISTTQIYAKVTDDKIDMDTRSLEEKIAGRFSVAI